MKKIVMILGTSVILVCFSFSVVAYSADESCSEPVNTTEGPVKGLAHGNYAACAWKGIPYAAPPTGELRWRATQKPEPRQNLLEAYEFGPSCPQGKTMFSGGEVKEADEDCLTLNIWSPQRSGKFPVMVWIHGGAFIVGSGSYDMYDGARLAAETEMVVVTINYRLGALGFLGMPELAEEDPNGSTGNYGLMDQIQALKWVRENIAEFGGDPNNVTIFGQSAGGMSVCCLLASPLARGFFHQAIPMSGGCDVSGDREEKYQQARTLAGEMGCEGADVLGCLRSKPAEDFVPKGGILSFISDMGGAMGYFPHGDGYVLKGKPIDAIREGNYNKVPVMVGHTRDEVRLFTMVIPGMSLLPRFLINKAIKAVFKDKADEIMELYSYSDYKHPSRLLLAIMNDAFISQGYSAAEALAANGTPVYLYRFDWDEIRFQDKMGAFHGLDIPFVFGNQNPESRISTVVRKKKDYEQGPMYWQIMYYYTIFAKTGDPNGPGPDEASILPAWPQYSIEKKERIYFDNDILVAPLTEKDIQRYEFFASEGMGGLLSRQ